MKILVPTFTRVGSTMLCEALSGLISVPKYKHLQAESPGGQGGISKAVIKQIQDYPENVVLKTHNFTVRQALPAFEVVDGLRIIGIRRDFKDVIVSNLLYQRNCRGAQGLNSPKPVQEMIEAYPQLDDKAWMNLVIDTKRKYVEGQMRRWMQFQHVVGGMERIYQVEYELAVNNKEAFVDELIDRLCLEPSEKQRDDAIERIKIDVMAEKYNHKASGKTVPFVRTGIPGDHRNWLDPEALYVLDQVRTKIMTK